MSARRTERFYLYLTPQSAALLRESAARHGVAASRYIETAAVEAAEQDMRTAVLAVKALGSDKGTRRPRKRARSRRKSTAS